jgi:tetratricopeptide (TPR) repeat protein
VASSYGNLGRILREAGRSDEAEAAIGESLAIYVKLAASYSSVPDFRQDLAMCHNHLGILFDTTGREKRAEEAYKKALAIQKQLASDFPARPDLRQDLARTCSNLGLVFRSAGRDIDAETSYGEALAIFKRLANDYPTRVEFRQELAGCQNNLGNLLKAVGRLDDADAALREAVETNQRHASEFPDQPDIRNSLAGSMVNLAILCVQRRQFQTAKEMLEEAHPHHLAAMKANPTNPKYRAFYRNNLQTLVRANAGLLNRNGAISASEKMRDLGWNRGQNAFDAAVALALCVPIVEKHRQLDRAGQVEAVQFYGDHVMAMLRLAVDNGFRETDQIKDVASVATLGQREDFAMLLHLLEKK